MSNLKWDALLDYLHSVQPSTTTRVIIEHEGDETIIVIRPGLDDPPGKIGEVGDENRHVFSITTEA